MNENKEEGVDSKFKAFIVFLILNKQTEKAVKELSVKYKVRPPRLDIGISKGKKKALGVYSVEGNTISFKDQEQFFSPFVVLHEMYHCIRSRSGTHRGNEKNADRFAIDYILAFNDTTERLNTESRREGSGYLAGDTPTSPPTPLSHYIIPSEKVD